MVQWQGQQQKIESYVISFLLWFNNAGSTMLDLVSLRFFFHFDCMFLTSQLADLSLYMSGSGPFRDGFFDISFLLGY